MSASRANVNVMVRTQVKNKQELFEKITEIYGNGISYTTIASFSDTNVIDCFNILKEMEIEVPRQVALMGYGNLVGGRLLEVPLSTVEMPIFEMGVQACRMMIDYLEGRGTLDKRIMDVRLIERQSA